MVSFPVYIATRSGRVAVDAWARAHDAQLVCHPVYENLLDDGAWVVTHRNTGRAINPSRTYAKDDALALIDLYVPLADWAAIHNSEEAQRVRALIESAYEQFVPPSTAREAATA